MSKTVLLGVRIAPDLKAELVAAAAADQRSLAVFVERALREWLAGQKK